ncbi:LytR C-terminal domain-containing protein [Kocuria soli]|nr:LytR C-terminal domain-containing protein [Kocuria soli]
MTPSSQSPANPPARDPEVSAGCTSSSASASSWPRDAFDDVPEEGARVGAHRALDAPAPRVTRQIAGLLLAGAVALAVGAAAYLLGGNSEAAPGAASGASASPSQSQSQSQEATESATPTQEAEPTVEPDASVQVGVYNAAEVDGAAGTTAQDLSSAGWTVSATDDWGVGVEQSVVYYADDEEQAQAVADHLGIEQVASDEAVGYPIVVVIGSDLAEDGA